MTALVYRHTGMIFGENKRYYIERRIADRMAAVGLTNLWTYLALAASGAESEQLINAFTINETYFYREEHQLAALSNTILPEIVSQLAPGARVRIWSMPCSTGEEAYSIAIWLLENWRLVDAYNIEIVGSDIDTAVLAQARAGLFNERSLARLPDAVRNAYFEPPEPKPPTSKPPTSKPLTSKPGSPHGRKIIDDLRESVQFTAVNLIDPASVAAQGRFDAVLCRNLLIYFDETARLKAADNIHDALKPGGFLCLGHSESMARITDRFTPVRLDDAMVYRRR